MNKKFNIVNIVLIYKFLINGSLVDVFGIDVLANIKI